VRAPSALQPHVERHLNVDEIVGRPPLLDDLQPLQWAQVRGEELGERRAVVGPGRPDDAPTCPAGQLAHVRDAQVLVLWLSTPLARDDHARPTGARVLVV
jgi:hypothetical protein